MPDDLLHVPDGLLCHVGHDQRAVVDPIDGLLGDRPHDRGRRHVAQLRVDRAEHRRWIHEDLVRREGEKRPARHRVVRDDHRDFPGVVSERVGDLLRREDEPAGRVQEEIDRPLVRCHPDRAQDGLGVIDVDEPVERHAQEPDRLLPVEERDDPRAACLLERAEGPRPLHRERAALERRQEQEREEENGEDRPDFHGGFEDRGQG